MNATIIDINEHSTRTPRQTIRAFLTLYTPEKVETTLWDIFKTCAPIVEKGNHEPQPGTIASLFDHLVALTKAVDQLQNSTTGKCGNCEHNQATDSS